MSRKILIVEDDKTTLDLLQRRLDQQGFLTDTAQSAREGMAKIFEPPVEQSFDLVLMDQIMPEISGLDAVRMIRRKFNPVDLPIIMVTSDDDPENMVSALGAGANDYVTKPISFPVLVARMNARIEIKVAYEELHREKEHTIAYSVLANIGEAAGSIAHDIGNPLAAAIMNCRQLKRLPAFQEGEAEIRLQKLTTCLDRVDQIRKSIRRISQSASPTMMPSRFAVSKAIHDSLVMLEERLQSSQVSVETEIDSDLWVTGNQVQIEQLINNLIANAADAVEGEAERKMRIRTRLNPGKTHVLVEVSDSGPGFQQGSEEQVFERYFTTKSSRGTGLGLHISRTIAENHGGTLRFKRNSGWTTFEFAVPRDDT